MFVNFFSEIKVSEDSSLLKSDRLLEICPFGWSPMDMENGEEVFKMDFRAFENFIRHTDLYIKVDDRFERVITAGRRFRF